MIGPGHSGGCDIARESQKQRVMADIGANRTNLIGPVSMAVSIGQQPVHGFSRADVRDDMFGEMLLPVDRLDTNDGSVCVLLESWWEMWECVVAGDSSMELDELSQGGMSCSRSS